MPYRTRPCDLVKPDQLAALELPPQPTGQAFECEWKPAGPNKVVDLDVMVNGNYLGQVYSESNASAYSDARFRKWEIFEPREVAGQPAVVFGSFDRFNCNVVVGTSQQDSLVVMVIAENRAADSCPRAVAIAERVVGNLAG